MKTDYIVIANKLIYAMGGKGNITQVFHCMTRLRFYVKDKARIDETEIKKLELVSGTNWSNGQFQVIIGNEVDAVYKAMVKKGVPSDDSSESGPKGGSFFANLVDAISGCMTPMIPALTAGGMIKVVLSLLTTFHLVSDASSTYQVISFVGDVVYYFMPMLIAANAARVFKVNQALALFVGGVFLHPNFVAMIAEEAPITLFMLPVTKFSYSYSVIPVIMMVWLMHYIEEGVDKITPKMGKIILNPTLVMLVSAPVALIVIGPLGGIIGNGLAAAISFLSDKLGFIIVGILAATFPFIVMTGMHHALTPIGLNAIATGGCDTMIFVPQICANIAQGGASLAVAFKSRDNKMKQLAGASGVSAIMGITEPALYGVTLKLKRPVIAAAIGAGIGGIVGGLLQVSLYIAQNCIMAVPAFIGERGMRNVVFGIIMMAVSFLAAFILTLVIGFEDEIPAQEETEDAPVAERSATERKLIEKVEVMAPVSGEIKTLSEVPDPAFAEKTLGDGAAIIPAEGRVVAPVDGVIATIMESKHGIMIQSDDGLELLIHVGLETVNLQGKYFTSHIKSGDRVKKGDLMLEFDMDSIRKAGYSLITPVVITNSDDYIKVVCMGESGKTVTAGERFLTIV